MIRHDHPSAVEAAAAALTAGEAIVLPTDTLYGVAALPGHEHLLCALKERPEAVPIAVLVADVAQAARVGQLDGAARRLAEAFWPGPLTIVVVAAGDGGTVGIRCPDHEFVRAVATKVGPIATTSANRHGQPTPPSAAEAAAALVAEPALVIDGGTCDGVASTVVDTTGPEPVVLREGALPGSTVLAALH